MDKYKFLLELKLIYLKLRETSNLCKKNKECFQLLKENLDEVCFFIKNPLNDLNWHKHILTKHDQQLISKIRSLAETSLGHIEKYQAQKILEGVEDHFVYSKELELAVKTEIREFDIKNNSKVLFIGSGAMPITAFTIYNETNSQISCLDRDEEAITLSLMLSKKWEMENISFFASEIDDLDVSKFTHIIIASLVEDKIEIANRLLSKIKKNTKLVLRYGNDLKSIFNHPLNSKEVKNCEKTIIKDRNFIYESLILEKR